MKSDLVCWFNYLIASEQRPVPQISLGVGNNSHHLHHSAEHEKRFHEVKIIYLILSCFPDMPAENHSKTPCPCSLVNVVMKTPIWQTVKTICKYLCSQCIL